MRMLPALLLALLTQVIAAAPSHAQLCITSEERRQEFRTHRQTPDVERDFGKFFERQQAAAANFINTNDAGLARAYLKEYGPFISERVRESISYFISATEQPSPIYSDINRVVAATNSLFPKISTVSPCQPETVHALVDLRIVLAAAVNTARLTEKCPDAAEYFRDGGRLVQKAMSSPDPFSVERGQADVYLNTILNSRAAVASAYDSVRDCRDERAQAQAEHQAESRRRQQAIQRQQQQQAYDEEQRRLRAQAAQTNPYAGWTAPQQQTPYQSPNYGPSSTTQPSLSDGFGGQGKAAPYRNPYGP